jgi:hypothetical protein
VSVIHSTFPFRTRSHIYIYICDDILLCSALLCVVLLCAALLCSALLCSGHWHCCPLCSSSDATAHIGLPIDFSVSRVTQRSPTNIDDLMYLPRSTFVEKRLELGFSGPARKSQKRFQDTPKFNFPAVFVRIEPCQRSNERSERGDHPV